jgi:bacillithiol system protein YtxJ
MVGECRDEADWAALVKASYEKPVFLFKHSTRCSISASRWQVFQGFAGKQSCVDCYRLMVVEDRALSAHVARAIGVEHESPQVILLHKGKAVWHTSHWSITEEEMGAALSKVL